MKEYVYRKLECLIDHKTGEPLRVYIPKDEIHIYDELSKKAQESGHRLRQLLQDLK